MDENSNTSAWGHMTGAVGVVDSLRRAGVERVFGIPSIEGTWLFDAFDASRIDFVTVTQEQSAVFMADATSRLTGELSACVLAPGQGLAKAMAAIAQAMMDSSPVVVLVAGAGPRGMGDDRSSSSISNQLAMVRSVAKRVLRIDEPEMVPSAMSRAVQLARQGEPGPVVVEIPQDVQRGSARMEGTGFRQGPRLLSRKAVAALSQTVQLMNEAQQVGLYVGAGSFDALDELKQLAEKIQAPVATSLSGLGALPSIHKLSVGFGAGQMGSMVAQAALSKCDLILAVGCKFSEMVSGGIDWHPDAPVIHIDIGPGNAGANIETKLAITAPARQALRYLLDRLQPMEHPEMLELIKDQKRVQRRLLRERHDWTDAVDPVKVFLHLREALTGEDVLVLDAGNHAMFAFASYEVQAARSLIAPVDYRASGFSVAAGVAAKLARPDQRVVACVGDGGFLQAHVELLTARRCNVDPVVAVFADNSLGMVKAFHQRVLGRQTEVDLVPIDYEQLAKSFGVEYLCIRHDGQLQEGIRKALTMEAPVVLELRVQYRDITPYVRIVSQLERKRLPRSATLKLGARLILKKLFKKSF